TFLPPSQLAQVDGQTVDQTQATIRYADQLVYPLAAQAVANATRYDWEFSPNSNFSPIVYTTSSTTPAISVAANAPGLESGQLYFARVSGVREATGARSDASPARSFYNALHPMYQEDPTIDLDRRRFGITTNNIVANSDEWIFQIAEADNDNDPSNDFDPSKIFSNPAAWGGNSTHPGVVGNVFKANRVSPNLPWGYQAAFGTIQAQPRTTYRVRVRAARKNPSGGYHQRGYWSQTVTFTTNAVPDRSHPITNITNLATNVENRESGQFTRIAVQGMGLLWDITGYQLQVSESADFTTGVVTTPSDAVLLSTTSVTEGNPVFFVPNLKFSTTYYARARSVATVKGAPYISSEWGPVTQFTTKANPAGRAVAYGQGAQSHAGDGQTVALPNPFSGSTRLRLNAAYGPLQVRVVDNLGREIAGFSANGGGEVTLGEKWPKGLYLVQVYNEHSLLEVIRVVKQ
ncbi:MAG TPA: T9SS type A sorting domain-containing protein, partial [Cytophagales bacterium]